MKLLNAKTYREAARICAIFVAVSVLVSLGAGELIAHLIGQPTDWKHYALSIGMPLMMTPLVVVPLVGMNLRLNFLRAELYTLARTDFLTGLMNRRAFFEKGTIALASGASSAAMMMIDVDRFKAFNDTHGHDTGDAVLTMISKTISSVADNVSEEGEAYLARMGGEEFALLVMPITPECAERLAAAVCRQVRATHWLHRGIELRPTVSLGLALGTGGESVEQLLKAADTAVYEAKQSGRDRWCLATPAMITEGNASSRELRTHPRAA
jgi:diguanylate cyclase